MVTLKPNRYVAVKAKRIIPTTLIPDHVDDAVYDIYTLLVI